jgi:hypothetical protein
VSAKIELTPEDREALLEVLTEGGDISSWLRGGPDGTGPGLRYKRTGLYDRINEDETLSNAIRIARVFGTDAQVEKAMEQLYAEPERYTDMSGATKIDPAYVALVKVRAEYVFKLVSKLNSGKYGDKVTTEHTGPGGGPVQIARIELVDLT